MQKACVAAAVALWMVQSACGGSLQVVGDYNVPWSPDTQPVLQYVLGVDNITDPFEVIAITKWQLTCQIIRPPETTGEIYFDVEDNHDPVSQPSSYVFGAVADTIEVYPNELADYPELPGTIASLGLIAEDQLFFPEGGEVPSHGANLLSINLRASSSASGRFDIAIVPDSSADAGQNDDDVPYQGAAWLSTDIEMMEFEGMPFDGVPVVVGSVLVTPIPEPSSGVLFLSGVIALAAAGRLWHRKTAG